MAEVELGVKVGNGACVPLPQSWTIFASIIRKFAVFKAKFDVLFVLFQDVPKDDIQKQPQVI